jgi:hypothetical protein
MNFKSEILKQLVGAVMVAGAVSGCSRTAKLSGDTQVAWPPVETSEDASVSTSDLVPAPKPAVPKNKGCVVNLSSSSITLGQPVVATIQIQDDAKSASIDGQTVYSSTLQKESEDLQLSPKTIERSRSILPLAGGRTTNFVHRVSGEVTVEGTTESCSASLAVVVPPPPAPTCAITLSSQQTVIGSAVNATIQASGNFTAVNLNGVDVTAGLNASKAHTASINPAAGSNTSNFNHVVSGSISGPGGKSNCTANLSVIVPPTPSCQITASTNPTVEGNPVTITMSAGSAYISSAKLDGNPVSLPYTASRILAATTTFTGEVVVPGPNAAGRCSLTVNVLPPAPSCTITLSSQQTVIGSAVNATIQASGNFNALSLAGNNVFAQAANGRYTTAISPAAGSNTADFTHVVSGSVSGPGGTATCSANLAVVVPPTPSCQITANVNPVAYNSPVTITMTSSSAHVISAKLDGNQVSLPHSITRSLTATTTFNGEVAVPGPNPAGRCSLTVSVQMPSLPACAITLSSQQTVIGTAVNATIQASGNFTAVSLASANVTSMLNASKSYTTSINPAAGSNTSDFNHVVSGSITGPGGTATCSANLAVIVPPTPSCQITASVNPVVQGNPVTITMSSVSANVSSATLDGVAVQLPYSVIKTLTATTTINGEVAVPGPNPAGRCSLSVNVIPPPPTCIITLSKQETVIGTPVNATIQASGNYSAVSLDGVDVTAQLNAAKQYTASINPSAGGNTMNFSHLVSGSISGPGGVMACTAHISVIVPPSPSCQIVASVNPVAYNSPVTISVSSTSPYVNGVKLDGVAFAQPPYSITRTLTANTTFNGEVTVPGPNPAGRCSLTVTVQPPPAPLCSITLSSASTVIGTAVTATIQASGNFNGLILAGIDAFAQSVNGKYTTSVNPAAGSNKTNFTHVVNGSVSGPGGTTNCSANLSVIVPPTPSCQITANPNPVVRGQLTTVSMTSASSYISAASFDGEAVTLPHSREVSLQTNRTYAGTVTVPGPNGSGRCSVTVNVTEPPPFMIDIVRASTNKPMTNLYLIVDNSHSMTTIQDKMSKAIQNLMESIVAKNLNVRLHLLSTTDMAAPEPLFENIHGRLQMPQYSKDTSVNLQALPAPGDWPRGKGNSEYTSRQIYDCPDSKDDPQKLTECLYEKKYRTNLTETNQSTTRSPWVEDDVWQKSSHFSQGVIQMLETMSEFERRTLAQSAIDQIKNFGILGSNVEQPIAVMYRLASQLVPDPTERHAFAIVTNEDDATRKHLLRGHWTRLAINPGKNLSMQSVGGRITQQYKVHLSATNQDGVTVNATVKVLDATVDRYTCMVDAYCKNVRLNEDIACDGSQQQLLKDKLALEYPGYAFVDTEAELNASEKKIFLQSCKARGVVEYNTAYASDSSHTCSTIKPGTNPARTYEADFVSSRTDLLFQPGLPVCYDNEPSHRPYLDTAPGSQIKKVLFSEQYTNPAVDDLTPGSEQVGDEAIRILNQKLDPNAYTMALISYTGNKTCGLQTGAPTPKLDAFHQQMVGSRASGLRDDACEESYPSITNGLSNFISEVPKLVYPFSGSASNIARVEVLSANGSLLRTLTQDEYSIADGNITIHAGKVNISEKLRIILK